MIHRVDMFLNASVFQMDSGCAAPTPSLHCQRIARAKWEFLFGTPAEEGASRGEKGENSSYLFYLLSALSLYTRVDLLFIFYSF